MDIYAREVHQGLGLHDDQAEVALLRPPEAVPRNAVMRRTRTFLDRYVVLPAALHRSATPIVHILDQAYAHLIPAARPAQVVITCHDCIPLQQPHLGVGWLLFRLMAVRQIRRADRVIAVSEATKVELVRRLHLRPDQIVVAPQGLEPDLFQARWHGLGSTLRILHVGTNVHYKRVSLVVETAARLGSRRRGVELWKAGVPLAANVQQRLVRAGVRLRNFGFVPRRELPAIFAQASVLLFPSTAEGFGRPVAEAMAVGLPVVASDIDSLKETTGGNARHVAGADPEAFARAIEALVEAPVEAACLSDSGRVWARRYRWETHTQTLRDLYLELGSRQR